MALMVNQGLIDMLTPMVIRNREKERGIATLPPIG